MDQKIAIVGCGLTGSMFVYSLCATAASLTRSPGVVLVDNDIVEHRNAPSNHAIPGCVGKKKAIVMSEVVSGYDMQVKPITQRLTAKNYASVLAGADLVIGAVDNWEARNVMAEASDTLGIPYMDIGINMWQFFVGWRFGDVAFTQTKSEGDMHPSQVVDGEKIPPCELVTSRIQAAIAVECAAKSLAIFLWGHDPPGIVEGLTLNKAEYGDMVAWTGLSSDGESSYRPIYVGRATQDGKSKS